MLWQASDPCVKPDDDDGDDDDADDDDDDGDGGVCRWWRCMFQRWTLWLYRTLVQRVAANYTRSFHSFLTAAFTSR